MKSIRLYRLGLISTFRFGLVLGLILNFLPTMIFTFLVLWGTSLVVRWLANLRSALPLPGGLSIPISTIELLGLQDLLRALEVIAGLAAWQIAALSVFLWLASALISGLLALVVVAVFNVIAQMAGGIEVTVDEGGFQPGGSQPGSFQPGSFQPSAAERSLAIPEQGVTVPLRGMSAAQGPFFEVVAPQQRLLPISGPGTIIGSDPSVGIVLGGLAPRHAQVVYDRGRILLIDLGGGNMWVRERPAEQVSLLEDGTMVQIGPWQMIFRAQRG